MFMHYGDKSENYILKLGFTVLFDIVRTHQNLKYTGPLLISGP